MQELKPVDLVVIGGGVNGAGIARDARAIDAAPDDDEIDGLQLLHLSNG